MAYFHIKEPHTNLCHTRTVHTHTCLDYFTIPLNRFPHFPIQTHGINDADGKRQAAQKTFIHFTHHAQTFRFHSQFVLTIIHHCSPFNFHLKQFIIHNSFISTTFFGSMAVDPPFMDLMENAIMHLIKYLWIRANDVTKEFLFTVYNKRKYDAGLLKAHEIKERIWGKNRQKMKSYESVSGSWSRNFNLNYY